MRVRARSLAALAAVATLAGCGASTPAQAPPSRPDDAFVVRIARHQQTALALARDAAADAHTGAVRRLARRMVASREQSLPALMQELAAVSSRQDLPDIGVSPAQTGEAISPDALNGAQPVDAAFLALMTAHDRGAMALARAEMRRGKNPAIKALAQRIEADSAAELGSMSKAMISVARSQHTS
jgi:uncharacterized protein (DUF305 family)